MTFVNDFDFAVHNGQLKHGNNLVVQKLRGNRAATHAGKLLLGKTDVLNGLDDPNLVSCALGLDWNHVMAAKCINTDVEFVNLNLTNILNRCPKMALQAICRQTKKYVNDATVADFRQQSLFIVQLVYANHLRSRIRYIDNGHVFPRRNPTLRGNQLEPVSTLSRPFDDPLTAFGLRIENAARQGVSVSKIIGNVAKISDASDPERSNRALKFFSTKLESGRSLDKVIKKHPCDHSLISIRFFRHAYSPVRPDALARCRFAYVSFCRSFCRGD